MTLDESDKNEMNKVNSIDVIIDKEFDEFLDDKTLYTIGYFKDPYNEGFTIDNGLSCQ